jgi:hypothetical protein
VLVRDPDSTAPPPSESARCTRPRTWPARQGGPPGLFKAGRAPRVSHPSRLSHPPPLAPRLTETLAQPPSGSCRREIAQEPRKEVRSILAMLVVDPVLRTARTRSPEFAAAPSRAAAWSVAAVASPPSAPPQLVSPSSALCLGTACAQGRAPPAQSRVQRRCPPPPHRRRPPPAPVCDPSHWIKIRRP